MQQTGKQSLPAWWYVDTFDYREVLRRDHTHLIAMEDDGILLDEVVKLRSENQNAIAITGNKREFLLLPNQWVTPRTEQIDSFWLAKELDFTAPEIEEIYHIIEKGSVWQSAALDIKLFGRNGDSIANRDITTIVPIGNGKYIATDGKKCSIISKREHNKTVISVSMQQIAVSQ